MNRKRSTEWCRHAAGFAALVALGLRASGGAGFPAAQRVLFETGFEPFEGYDAEFSLGGQAGWTALGSGGNGILPGPVAGFDGQVAYVGFNAPQPKDDLLNVFRPVALVPVAGDLPLITFTVSFQIFDSTAKAPYFDDFRWSAYNTREERLFTLDFDNAALEVHLALDDGKGFVPTGFKFKPNEPYDLRVTLNFARNLWTADVNGAVVANGVPISTKGAKLDLNEIDAVWAVRDIAHPGDNFMVFDDYRLTALPVREIPSSVELVGRATNGDRLVRVLGEPGIRYVLESSTDLVHWTTVGDGLAQSPGGAAEFRDAASGPARFYRAHGPQ